MYSWSDWGNREPSPNRDLVYIKSLNHSGFNIQNVYYSTRNRIVVKESFTAMKCSPFTYTTTGVIKRDRSRSTIG